MNNLNTIFKSKYLVLAIVLFSACFGYAQPVQVVVRVPVGCNVVVPGLGGSTGFGGTVGDQGVVAMPDPFPFDFFIANPSAGVTIGTWSLLGDLSFKDGSGPNLWDNPIISYVGNTAPIRSYNKKLRPSENVLPLFDPIWGRSKGRVKLTYSATCGGSITFEVYKVYLNNPRATPPSNVPQIVGNTTCLLPNTQYTFSVDQIASDNANDSIGFDSYYWSGIPNGASVNYYSADFSSITFTTGVTVPATSTLTCCYGRVNPTWDGGISNTAPNGTTILHQTCVSIGLKPAPVAPPINSTVPTTLGITATNLNGCLDTGVSSFSLTYPNIPVTTPATTYTWSVVSGVGWNIGTTTSGANTTMTVTGIDNNPGILKLTIYNGCTPVDFIYNIRRRFVAPSMAISPANTCVLAGSTNTFTTNGLANGTSWSISPTVTGFPANNLANVGSSLTFTLPSTATGSYTLTASGNTSGTYTTCGGSVTTTIYVKPATPTNLAGPTCVTRNGGSAVTYTCDAVTGATGYKWSFPSGWTTGNATVTTSTPTVTITPNGNTGSGSVTVVALGVTGATPACDSTSATLPINYAIVAPAITLVPSCYNVNMASTITVNVTNAPTPFFGVYTVSMTAVGTTTPNFANTTNGSFTAGTGTTGTISFNTIDTVTNLVSNPTLVSPPPGIYNVTITFDTQATGGTCATTASTTIQVTIPPASTATLFTSYNSATNGADNYIVQNPPANAQYSWYIGNAPIIGAVSSSLLLNGNTGLGGRVSVQIYVPSAVVGACASITKLIAPILPTAPTHGLRQVMPNKNLGGIVIYPNPSEGNFTVDLETVKQSAVGILYDMNGKEIAVYLLKKGENSIQNEGLAKGTYLLTLYINDQKTTKKISIK